MQIYNELRSDSEVFQKIYLRKFHPFPFRRMILRMEYYFYFLLLSVMDYKIIRAKPGDYKLIAALGARTFYETWRPVNSEEDMQVYIKRSFEPQIIKSELENDSVNTFLIAFGENKEIGYVKMRNDRVYDDFKNEAALEIERIYVLKEWQDKKAGKALMDESISLALKNDYKWLWLGVNVDNHKAINFYKKYGFTVFGEKSFQLGAAVDTDFLMKLNLP